MALHELSADTDALSRREFLRGAVGVLGATRVLGAGGSTEPDSAPLRLGPGKPPARVVQCRSHRVVLGTTVRLSLLREMLDATVASLTGAESATAAWRKLFEPDDVIGLKFNSSAQTGLGTSPAFADALLGSLTSAGWSTESLVLIEAPTTTIAKWQTTPAWVGFEDSETEFGSGADQIARVVGQLTALISIPFLKTHNIASITGSLKNVSHAMVKHPGRYHAGGCSPYIPDIVAIPAIRSRLRLSLVDGLRAVIRGGPDAASDGIVDAGYLLASTDPVAVDSQAVTILNQLRGERGIGRIAASAEAIPHLRAAHEKGLGVATSAGIEVVAARVDL